MLIAVQGGDFPDFAFYFPANLLRLQALAPIIESYNKSADQSTDNESREPLCLQFMSMFRIRWPA